MRRFIELLLKSDYFLPFSSAEFGHIEGHVHPEHQAPHPAPTGVCHHPPRPTDPHACQDPHPAGPPLHGPEPTR